jgi:ABC-type branched-subunit amino acid transport system substrate-binding protein
MSTSLYFQRSKRRHLTLSLLLWLAYLSTATNAQAETGVDNERILIGQSAAFSSPASLLGVQMNFGAKLYFDSINARGGVHCRKLELQAEDDMYEPNTAAENTKQLLEHDKVFALFGYVGSATSEAAIPFLSKTKVPFFAPLSGANSLRNFGNPGNRSIFHVRASYEQEVATILRQLAVTNTRSVAVFYQDDTDGKGILKNIETSLKQHKLSLVATAMVQANAVFEEDRYIQKAVATFLEKRPQVILLASTYGSSATFVKQLRLAGYLGQFYSLSLVGSRALSEALGKDGNGVVISQTVPSPWSPKYAIVEEYRKAMQKAGKKDLDFTSLEGFIAAKTFVIILKEVGRDLTREKFIDTAVRMGAIELGDFPVRFSSSSHEGSRFVELVVIGKDGKFVR